MIKTSIWTRILDFISPRLCVVCGERLSPTERAICTVCMMHLPRTNYQFCSYDNPMARLFWGIIPVEHVAALYFYEPHSEAASIVYRLKYSDRPDIGEDMGRLMASEMAQGHFFDGIDALLPVPLSRKRMRQRGYNQSEMLAVGISQITQLPIITTALRRKHFVKSQTTLDRRERQENVEGIFELKDDRPLRHRHVLLIDDVCTTGATLIACAEQLRAVDGIKMSILTLGLTNS